MRDNETPTQITLLLLRIEISRKKSQTGHPKLPAKLTDARLFYTTKITSAPRG